LAAARALMDSKHSAREIAERSMAVAAEICVYTNTTLTIEELDAK
ncbi:MAG: ATP-dependent protease subunit HslV, partial [Alphaproteobacteria bacterium]